MIGWRWWVKGRFGNRWWICTWWREGKRLFQSKCTIHISFFNYISLCIKSFRSLSSYFLILENSAEVWERCALCDLSIESVQYRGVPSVINDMSEDKPVVKKLPFPFSNSLLPSNAAKAFVLLRNKYTFN